jgi:hypothetical protein
MQKIEIGGMESILCFRIVGSCSSPQARQGKSESISASNAVSHYLEADELRPPALCGLTAFIPPEVKECWSLVIPEWRRCPAVSFLLQNCDLFRQNPVRSSVVVRFDRTGNKVPFSQLSLCRASGRQAMGIITPVNCLRAVRIDLFSIYNSPNVD